jgi:hypothetical protein
MKNWKVSLGFLALLVILGSYLITPRPEPGAGIGADKLCRKLLAENEHREALTWAKESKPGDLRTIGEQSPEESFKIINNLYTSGAISAQIVKIERVSGLGETSNIVCVELPTAPGSRVKLFKIEAKTASNEGFDPTPDEGQTYLFLSKFKLSRWQVLRALLHH